jgi:CRP-like cAMP-binding protein
VPSVGDTRIKRVLKGFPLFAGLASEHLGELAGAARSSVFLKDQAIYRAGDPVRWLYVLLSGQVKLALSCNQGNEKIIDVVEAGRSFGEAELFGPHPSLVDAVAVKSSQVLAIDRENLCRIMTMDSRVALRVMQALALRQIEMETELAATHPGSGSQQLLNFLVRLAGPGRARVGETLVTLSVSKQLLASRFNMKPETLSRKLRDLAAGGLISVDGHRIRLKNIMIDRYLAGEVTRSGSPCRAVGVGAVAPRPAALQWLEYRAPENGPAISGCSAT